MLLSNGYGYGPAPWQEVANSSNVVYYNPKENPTFLDKFFQGLENFWYSFTGQTEKTSAYQAQMEREDSAMQRLAEDYKKAGLNKFGISGNGAQTGSYGNGAPQMLSMLGAIADIKKTNAEAGYIGAQTEGQQNINRTFQDKFQADMDALRAGTYLTHMQGRIAKTEGDFAAEKIIAEISQYVSSASEHLKNIALKDKQLEWYDEDMRSTVEGRDKTIQLDNQRIANLRLEGQKIAHDITYLVAQTNHVNQQTKTEMMRTISSWLDANILTYNYEWSRNQGIRTTDASSRLGGIDLKQLNQNANNQFWKLVNDLYIPNWFKK